MKQAMPLDLLPVWEENLSAQAFLDLVHESPELVAHSEIKMPRLGEAGFGSFHVEYSRPVYKPASEVLRR